MRRLLNYRVVEVYESYDVSAELFDILGKDPMTNELQNEWGDLFIRHGDEEWCLEDKTLETVVDGRPVLEALDEWCKDVEKPFYLRIARA